MRSCEKARGVPRPRIHISRIDNYLGMTGHPCAGRNSIGWNPASIVASRSGLKLRFSRGDAEAAEARI